MSRIIQDKQETLPVIGLIKCGKKIKKDDKEYPISLDHFIATGDYAYKFEKAFPEKTDKIEIVFLDDYEAYSCNQRYELRKGANWYAKGDGKYFSYYNKKTGNFEGLTTDQEPNLMERLEAETGEKFKAKLTLRFGILRIRDILGVWQFGTAGEKTSVRNIVNVYDFVKNNAGGRIKGFTFDLKVKKVTSDKYNTKSNYPIVELIPHASAEHVELVRNCIEQNIELPLMLEPNKIETLQIENNIILERITHTTTYIPPDETEMDLIKKIDDILFKVSIPADMIQASKEIDDLNLSPEYKKIANKMKNEKLHSLRG